MNPETNNDIDLLLRRMSGRDGDAAAGVTADDRHLDADELNSYAQHALPPAARARYTEHLADCAACRKLVTELSLSLGAVATAAVETVPATSGLKKFLASLFSPLVLRYAVPALGVIVVMIVGFVVLRQQRQHDMVATMNDQVKESERVSASSPAPAKGFQDEQARSSESDSVARKPAEPKTRPQSGAGEAAGTASSAPVTVAKDDRSAADAQPTVAAATPAPPAPAKATVAEPEIQTTDTVAKKQPAEVKSKLEAIKQQANANEPRDEIRVAPQTTNRKDQDKPKAERSETRGLLGGVASARPGAAATRRAADTKREQEKSDEAGKRRDSDQVNEETRTVAGRHFRKARGIWTDTAYDSSTATVNMARDSEQFRALVADEPAIATIAKQLDGEVIVVWKGRAYHIR